MAENIPFPLPDEAYDLNGLDRSRLETLLEEVREQIEALDTQEPEDMDSEEYDAWGDRHEELEDLADEITERLEELEGER